MLLFVISRSSGMLRGAEWQLPTFRYNLSVPLEDGPLVTLKDGTRKMYRNIK